jgi:hypothetical protein
MPWRSYTSRSLCRVMVRDSGKRRLIISVRCDNENGPCYFIVSGEIIYCSIDFSTGRRTSRLYRISIDAASNGAHFDVICRWACVGDKKIKNRIHIFFVFFLVDGRSF